MSTELEKQAEQPANRGANACYNADLSARIEQVLEIERQENRERVFWMSFCDIDKPKGSQFQGVIIIKALGLVHAIQKTWQLGINPGGEVKSFELREEDIHQFAEVSGRLLGKEELKEYGFID